jgi:hypothetical protein
MVVDIWTKRIASNNSFIHQFIAKGVYVFTKKIHW